MHARVLNAILVLLATATALAVPAPITTPGTTTDTGAANASTRVLATSTSAPATSTSAPATSTRVPATSTSAPTTGISAPSTNSNALLPTTIPPGYTYWPATGKYYKFHHERTVSWHVANTTCAGEGAHLLVVNDAEEAYIAARIVIYIGAVSEYYDQHTWTGLRDNQPGGVMEWRTVHGETVSDVYNVWGVGRPINYPGYTCAYLNANEERLYDAPCDWSRYFICEIHRSTK